MPGKYVRNVATLMFADSQGVQLKRLFSLTAVVCVATGRDEVFAQG